MSIVTPLTTPSYLPLILFTVFTNGAAQILLKQGMLNFNRDAGWGGSPVATVVTILLNPFVFAGLLAMVISMASHLYVLSKVPLSFAYPFLSLAYVLVTAYAWLGFGETIGPARLGGIALICLGTFFIAQS